MFVRTGNTAVSSTTESLCLMSAA